MVPINGFSFLSVGDALRGPPKPRSRKANKKAMADVMSHQGNEDHWKYRNLRNSEASYEATDSSTSASSPDVIEVYQSNQTSPNAPIIQPTPEVKKSTSFHHPFINLETFYIDMQKELPMQIPEDLLKEGTRNRLLAIQRMEEAKKRGSGARSEASHDYPDVIQIASQPPLPPQPEQLSVMPKKAPKKSSKPRAPKVPREISPLAMPAASPQAVQGFSTNGCKQNVPAQSPNVQSPLFMPITQQMLFQPTQNYPMSPGPPLQNFATNGYQQMQAPPQSPIPMLAQTQYPMSPLAGPPKGPPSVNPKVDRPQLRSLLTGQPSRPQSDVPPISPQVPKQESLLVRIFTDPDFKIPESRYHSPLSQTQIEDVQKQTMTEKQQATPPPLVPLAPSSFLPPHVSPMIQSQPLSPHMPPMVHNVQQQPVPITVPQPVPGSARKIYKIRADVLKPKPAPKKPRAYRKRPAVPVLDNSMQQAPQQQIAQVNTVCNQYDPESALKEFDAFEMANDAAGPSLSDAFMSRAEPLETIQFEEPASPETPSYEEDPFAGINEPDSFDFF
ncbi:Protein CBG25371 [Caenorhabditis briggsae]|uniref:Uncharacterized protein n=2 Tax=Caenorhabditis briggsae TaxID=6238 RepID=A0AAE9IZY4_CAEBR|nr:Protein CBG25371 [Caenorhabditis briggsae]ULU13017.1 hypothetical protein L3Y34_015903 [Caenorhabditis briggsae]CAR99765.1 Protein CBG25371 [Caenorhabditis briggsae]